MRFWETQPDHWLWLSRQSTAKNSGNFWWVNRLKGQFWVQSMQAWTKNWSDWTHAKFIWVTERVSGAHSWTHSHTTWTQPLWVHWKRKVKAFWSVSGRFESFAPFPSGPSKQDANLAPNPHFTTVHCALHYCAQKVYVRYRWALGRQSLNRSDQF